MMGAGLKPKQALIGACMLLLGHLSRAQNFNKYYEEPKTKITFGIGAAGYYGDLQNELIIPYPSATVMLSHKLSPQVHIREALSWYVIGASDENSPHADLRERNLSFISSNVEMSLTLTFDLIPVYHRKPVVNPFIFFGVGVTTLNPKARKGGKTYKLHKYHTEGVAYRRLAMTLPVGVGIKLRLNKNVSLTGEIGYHFTNSDYLDDVSTDYPELASLQSVARSLSDRRTELGLPQAREGGQRGNPERNDGLIILNIGLEGALAYFFYR